MAKRTKQLPPPPKGKKVSKKKASKRRKGKAPPRKEKKPKAARIKVIPDAGSKPKADKANVPMTEAQVKQAMILFKNPGISPAAFAKEAWPDAEGWKSKIRTGTGPSGKVVTKIGGAMNVAAGAALGKLRIAGWADFSLDKEDGRTKRYSLTKAGVAALEKSKGAY